MVLPFACSPLVFQEWHSGGPVAPRGLRYPALIGIKSGHDLLVALPMYANRTPAAQTLWQFASNSAHEQNGQRE